MDSSATARFQLAGAALFLSLWGLALAYADHLDASDWRLVAGRTARAKALLAGYTDCRYFWRYEDRVMVDLVNRFNFDQAYTCFVGSSLTRALVADYGFPEGVRSHVLNLGMSATRHSEQKELIRYLQESRGIIHPNNPCVFIFELSFVDSTHAPSQERTELWNSYFTSTGVMRIDGQGKIRDRAYPSLVSSFILLENRSREVWPFIAGFNGGKARSLYYLSQNTPESQTKFRADFWQKYFGPGWSQGMDAQIEALTQMVNYVRANGGRAAAFWAPERTWMLSFPQRQAYRERVTRFLDSEKVAALDLSRSVDDGRFIDGTHVGFEAAQSLIPEFLRLADKAGP